MLFSLIVLSTVIRARAKWNRKRETGREGEWDIWREGVRRSERG